MLEDDYLKVHHDPFRRNNIEENLDMEEGEIV